MRARPRPLPDPSLRGGEESLVVLHKVGSESVVLKTGTNIAEEARALRLAHARGVPVPRVRTARGSRLYMDWIPGKEPAFADADAAFMRRLGAALRALHGIRVPGIGNLKDPRAYSPAAWRSLLTRRFRRGMRILAGSRRVSAREAARLEERFAELLAAGARPFKPALLHGDLHLYNTRLKPDDAVVLLDFNDAFLGDPLYDFAPFRYFCPAIFARFRKAYSSEPFENEKPAMRLYSFLQAIEAAAFYVGIGNRAHADHALRLARKELR